MSYKSTKSYDYVFFLSSGLCCGSLKNNICGKNSVGKWKRKKSGGGMKD